MFCLKNDVPYCTAWADCKLSSDEHIEAQKIRDELYGPSTEDVNSYDDMKLDLKVNFVPGNASKLPIQIFSFVSLLMLSIVF